MPSMSGILTEILVIPLLLVLDGVFAMSELATLIVGELCPSVSRRARPSGSHRSSRS